MCPARTGEYSIRPGNVTSYNYLTFKMCVGKGFKCCSYAGRPTHYFFILIRYGPCNIVATPLATAADVENGDTIMFPTSITL